MSTNTSVTALNDKCKIKILRAHTVCISLPESENESDVDAHNDTTVFDVSSSSFSPTATVVVPLVVLVLGVVAVSILCYHKRHGGRPRLKWCGLATKESMKLGKVHVRENR